jgi:murein DD-endopeptidase MepM/ murein hydrolase activator NlpD
MKIYIILFFFLVIPRCYAQKGKKEKWMKNYTWEWVNTDSGTKAIVDNNNLLPITVVLDYDLVNLKSDKPNGTYVVVPASAKGFEVVNMTIINPKKGWKFKGNKSLTYLGDLTDTEYDSEHIYKLPFAKGKSFRVSQGVNGKISHHDQNAWDFDMPEGSKVFAVRDGLVVDTEKKNSKNCKDKSCVKFNNYIKILHDDGTVIEYLHLKKNGVKVKPGQKVKAGLHIGNSGNTGWSTGPHLHISLYLKNKDNERVFLPMKFQIADGSVVEELKEGTEYAR